MKNAAFSTALGAAALVLLLAACGGENPPSSEKHETAAPAAPASSETAAKADKAATDDLAELPGWFPKSFPLPPTTATTWMMDKEDDGAGRLSLVLTTKLEPSKTFDFYVKALPEAGFENIETETDDSTGDRAIDADAGEKAKTAMGGFDHVGMLISPTSDLNGAKTQLTLNFERD